jgi:hypothetical protein
MIYFQGGGVCWDKYSTVIGACSTTVVPQLPIGVFDRTNPLNAFKSYTIIHIPYCSGDFFVGNVIRDFTDNHGIPVTQKGYANARSVITWIQQQMKSGDLSSTLEDLVVMGCSAGSIGTQLWAKTILSEFTWKHAAIVPDSAIGVAPPGAVSSLLTGFNMCTVGVLSNELTEKCQLQQLSMQDIIIDAMTAYQHVPFAFITSKADDVQIGMYTIIGLPMWNIKKFITPREFYSSINADFFGPYNRYPNFITYLIDGIKHCFTEENTFYTASTLGPDNKKTIEEENHLLLSSVNISSSLKLYEWVSLLPLPPTGTTDTQCTGNLQSMNNNNNNNNIEIGQTYCDTKVVPKHYIQP